MDQGYDFVYGSLPTCFVVSMAVGGLGLPLTIYVNYAESKIFAGRAFPQHGALQMFGTTTSIHRRQQGHWSWWLKFNHLESKRLGKVDLDNKNIGSYMIVSLYCQCWLVVVLQAFRQRTFPALSGESGDQTWDLLPPNCALYNWAAALPQRVGSGIKDQEEIQMSVCWWDVEKAKSEYIWLQKRHPGNESFYHNRVQAVTNANVTFVRPSK